MMKQESMAYYNSKYHEIKVVKKINKNRLKIIKILITSNTNNI